MDLQKQFSCTNNEDLKRFEFQALTDETTSYTVDYSECDSEEPNAWIILFKAVKKDYKLFKVSFKGRLKNASGIFYRIKDTVFARDQKEAVLNLYNKYEHLTEIKFN